jgi:excisionase family DNA binding protein
MAASLEGSNTTSSNSSGPPPAPISHLLDIHGVAEVLSVTPRHVQRLVAERRIPYLKIGRCG